MTQKDKKVGPQFDQLTVIAGSIYLYKSIDMEYVDIVPYSSNIPSITKSFLRKKANQISSSLQQCQECEKNVLIFFISHFCSF